MNRAMTASISALSPNFERSEAADSAPVTLRACEVEALAWSTATGWGTTPAPSFFGFGRSILRRVFGTRGV